MKTRRIRIGIDVGGTFTDFALLNEDTFHTTKVLTTHQAPEQAIMQGLNDIMTATDVAADDVEIIIHGTTLATNAIIERKGAKTAMLTTDGFRDVLEMGLENRFDQYDLNLTKPQPLIPRHLRFGIPERLAADGSVLVPLDTEAIQKVAKILVEKDIESVAICFLHSYINPEHEQHAANELTKHIPDLHLSLSSAVSPEIREYERFSTTAGNAYIQPKINDYLQRLQIEIRAAGFHCPIYLFLSNGGIVELDVACRYPIRLVESGPAGGAVFASHVARMAKEDRVLSFDMGGTTAKICLIDNAEPQKTGMFEMARSHRFKQGSGLPVKIPVVEMVEIGAGGGSIARIDNLQRITVGPDSAGSEPGPACYGFSGSFATVTDANLLLGRLDSDGFADGTMKLDKKAAETAIMQNLAKPLQIELPIAAFGVTEIIEEDMANAAREHATESGKSLTERTLIAFGGAAPLHAVKLAEKLGINHIIIPKFASVGSAIGFLLAPVSFELSKSCKVRLSQFEVEILNTLITEMKEYAHRVVKSGAPDCERTEIRLAHMRYVGQGYNIPIDIPVRTLDISDNDQLQNTFNNVYQSLYKRLHDGVEVEIVGVSVSVSAYGTQAQLSSRVNSPGKERIKPDYTSLLYDTALATYYDVPIFSRNRLLCDHVVDGPALIKDRGTTILVPTGYIATTNELDHLVIEGQQETIK